MKKNNTPELLLPAGSVENFRAAVAGGADAVYLGLRLFNARGRASNFTFGQFVSVLKEAKEKNVQVYVTLNTVIKNQELPTLLDTLFFLSKTPVNAIIIQDWGVYLILKKYFPNIIIHASTQMGNHNSLGAIYSEQKGIERVILARELIKNELQEISAKTKIELEYFIHGALCYSFSGMCLFSSYLGGVGANRGLCAQPCRRAFSDNTKKYLFSLKDNQLIDELNALKKTGIASLKVEGRMKSAEYVYTTAAAYRKALDNKKIIETKQSLKFDMGREKTAYFFGGNVSNAITPNPNTGIFLGKVVNISKNGILFSSNQAVKEGNRIRFVGKNADEQINHKITSITEKSSNHYFVEFTDEKIKKDYKVFLIGGVVPVKFSNKIKEQTKIPPVKMPKHLKNNIISSLRLKKSKQERTLFLRIDSLKWLRKIWFDKFDYLIINLSSAELKEFNPETSFIKKNNKKIWFELPKFIPESKINFYKEHIIRLHKSGIKKFFISHLSQKLLLPQKSIFATNENVYVFNDAASKLIVGENAQYYTYPLEIDFESLYSIKNRDGIIPVYFHPDLFYSRMPVKVQNENNIFQDDQNRKYTKTVKDGVTIVRPAFVVSTLKHRQKMEKLGYHNFLIDFTGISASKHIFNNIIKAYNNCEVVSNSTNFNLRRTLK